MAVEPKDVKKITAEMIFEKSLTHTDVTKRLSIPTRSLVSLPPFGGGFSTQMVVRDETGCSWRFVCSVRRNRRYLKPVLSQGWLAFVREKGLKVGDKISFYESVGEETKIFGALLGRTHQYIAHIRRSDRCNVSAKKQRRAGQRGNHGKKTT